MYNLGHLRIMPLQDTKSKKTKMTKVESSEYLADPEQAEGKHTK